MKPLTKKLVTSLARRIKENDPQAFEELFEQNKCLVLSVARKYMEEYPSYSDGILSAAYRGFIKAALSYKPITPSPSTHFFIRIRGAIRNYIRNESLYYSHFPTPDIDWNKLRGKDGIPVNQAIKADLQQFRERKVEEALQTLSPEEKRIIYLHDYQKISLSEIGKIFGIRQQTVSLRRRKILKKLERFFNRTSNLEVLATL